ncbi:MAG: UDP-N-acetylmuramoyl-L-alanine--D-glutamate ligase [bacterium]|nr:UDP-N-acetylmuramoyl-L-alanine--D-glutamate ligase [bacterium]
MIPVTQYNGHAVAVLGLGRSGLSAARALKAGGATPVCWDDNEDSLSAAEAEGFLIANLHSKTTWREHEFAALILSPGIPHLYPEPNPIVKLAWGHGVPVDNDVGLFFSLFTGHWNSLETEDEPWPECVAVTGSNGKSTTTALVAHILQAAGKNVEMGGNIGRGVLDLEPPSKGVIYVLELSSYQTELARTLSPSIAVFLNFSPDHFDRHGGRGGYFAAKKRLFEKSGIDRMIIGIDEPEGCFLANQLRQDADEGHPVTAMSVTKSLRGRGWSFFAQEDQIIEWAGGKELARIKFADMPALKGLHNQQNACAAFAVCKSLGLTTDEISTGLKTFSGLKHRMEYVGRLGTISFVNDSKATNVESAAKALGAYQNIYWIAGGQGKEGGLDGLKGDISNVKKAYLIGQSAFEFSRLLGDTPHEIAQTLECAITLALQDADADEQASVILLAPACASFDQFPSFEHRGDTFCDQVLALINKDMR